MTKWLAILALVAGLGLMDGASAVLAAALGLALPRGLVLALAPFSINFFNHGSVRTPAVATHQMISQSGY